MKKFVLIICMIFAFGLFFSGSASACTEGCTPGYWKQPHHMDSWNDTDYLPGDDFDTIFGVDLFEPDVTLLEALNLRGGGLNAFARHAVAALLNASSPFVDCQELSVVLEKVKEAKPSGPYDYERYKNLFEGWNELGCPLD